MRFLMHLVTAALLVAVGIGGMTSATAADRAARNAVMGRQKIRAELSAALAKGYLTRIDQYQILLHAKDVLTADDLHGLEQTLDRIARQQASEPAAATIVPGETRLRQNAKESELRLITPSKYEELQGGEMPTIDPAPKKAKVLSDGPFVEEVPAGIGQPTIHLDGDDPEDCGCDSEACRSRSRWFDIECFSSVDAFKGPLDVNNGNGNFGLRLGANAAVAILPRLGVALQAGTSVGLSDFKGTNYPINANATSDLNATSRDQIFTTVGVFQRITGEGGAFTWGFAYDWLFDNYYSSMQFGQWRVKGAWEFNACNEIGLQASLPEHGSTGTIYDSSVAGYDHFDFRPLAQGCLYWKHTWNNDASLTGRVGLAERPGEFVFGAAGRMPLTKNLALTSDFTYIMPNGSGGPNFSNEGSTQAQEIWNLSVGIEFALGGFGRCCTARCQPFLPVADNGSLAVHQVSPIY